MNEDFFKLGIIGNPLSHSVSPVLQKAALVSVGINGSYEKFEVKKDDLSTIINMFLNEGFSGFNVTIPYKTEIIKYLDEIDNDAQKIGAVNTVKITSDRKFIGYNTDMYGFCSSLEGKNITNAVIIGCGGAALAVVFGLEMLGCKNLKIYARNPKKADIFIQNIEQKTKIKLCAKPLERLDNLEDTDILINATPLGTKGENENKSPVREEIFSTAKKSIIAYDLVYNPAKTLFLQNAEKYKLSGINGLDMLIFQGAKAFEIWTDKTPDVEKMRVSARNEILSM